MRRAVGGLAVLLAALASGTGAAACVGDATYACADALPSRDAPDAAPTEVVDCGGARLPVLEGPAGVSAAACDGRIETVLHPREPSARGAQADPPSPRVALAAKLAGPPGPLLAPPAPLTPGVDTVAHVPRLEPPATWISG